MFISAMALGLLGGSFVAPMVFGLFWPKANTSGAIMSIIGGFITVILTSKGVLFEKALLGMNPFIWGLSVSVIFMLFFSIRGKRNSDDVLKVIFEK